jgi:hypothetical protein
MAHAPARESPRRTYPRDQPERYVRSMCESGRGEEVLLQKIVRWTFTEIQDIIENP